MTGPIPLTVQVLDQAPTVVVQDEQILVQVVSPTPVVVQVQTGQQGLQGLPGAGGDLSSVFTQAVASATWVVPIPTAFATAGKVPSVTVVDTAGNWNIGAVVYQSPTQLTIYFSAPFSGSAYLN